MTSDEKLDQILSGVRWIEDTIRGAGFGAPRILPGDGSKPVQPPQPQQPPQPPVGNTVFLGDMPSGSPNDNRIDNMAAGTNYAKRQVLSGLSGWVEFRCGYLANYDLPSYVSWISSQPGGVPCEVRGCEPQEMSGANISVHAVNMEMFRAIGLTEIYVNVRANGATGRYFQRNP